MTWRNMMTVLLLLDIGSITEEQFQVLLTRWVDTFRPETWEDAKGIIFMYRDRYISRDRFVTLFSRYQAHTEPAALV